MALVSNAYDTYATKTTSMKEDLQGVVFLVSPEATPVLQMASSRDVTNPTYDWQVQSLPTVATAAALEGDTITRQASSNTTRRSNVCQILTRNATVTNTQAATEHAGIDDMLAHQVQLNLRALKRDAESVLLLKQAKAAGSVTVARTTAAFSSWLTSNTTHGSGGSAATGDGSDTVTDGSTTVLTKVKINTAMKNAFAATSELPTKLICGPFNKTKISAFDESGTNMRRMVDSNTVGSSVEIIESDFGALEILPDNFGRERDVHLINPDYITISYLRNWEMRSIASQGDVSDTRAIYVEFGAQVDNEAAHAAVYDNTVS